LDGTPTFTRYKMSPFYQSLIDISILCYTLFVQWRTDVWREVGTRHRRRTIALAIILVIAIIEAIICTLLKWPQLFINWIKAIIVLICYETARTNFISIFKVYSTSREILYTILAYIGINSFFAYFLFKNSLQGYSFF
jgi:multidrug transporter EmrE-like cation transporter